MPICLTSCAVTAGTEPFPATPPPTPAAMHRPHHRWGQELHVASILGIAVKGTGPEAQTVCKPILTQLGALFCNNSPYSLRISGFCWLRTSSCTSTPKNLISAAN